MPKIREIANLIQLRNPEIQLYWNVNRNAIGYWARDLGRVQVLAGELVTGQWAPVSGLLVNNVPLFKPADWEPIPAEDVTPCGGPNL